MGDEADASLVVADNATDAGAFDDDGGETDPAAAAERRFKIACIFWFEGVLVPAVGAVGVLGNVLSILVLKCRDLDLKGSFVDLLVTLCVFDTLFIAAVVMFYCLPIHSDFYEQELIPYLTPVLLPLIHIVLTGSVYSVVAVSVERYWIICNPFGWNVQDNGKKFIAAIVVFSVIYNLNKFFEVSVGYTPVERTVWNDTVQSFQVVNVSKAVVTITSLRANADYLKAVIITNFFTMVVIPLLVLCVCHVLTFRTIRENTRRHNAISNHQRRDDAMAMLFFIIISFFVVCHSGKFVLNFYEMSQIFSSDGDEKAPWPLWAFFLTRVNHFLLVINSSVNFFIYCFRDMKFRNALLSLLGLRSPYGMTGASSRHASTINNNTQVTTLNDAGSRRRQFEQAGNGNGIASKKSLKISNLQSGVTIV